MLRDHVITKRNSVRTLDGSPRHVSKTHGSHNGRTHTWPHPSDAIERPPKLPDLADARGSDIRRGRRHKRARQPMRVICKSHYQDPARDIPALQRWDVSGQRIYDNCYVSVRLCAHSEDEAVENAELILRRSHMCIIVNIEARRANT